MVLVVVGAALYQSRLQQAYSSSVSITVDSVINSGGDSEAGVTPDAALVSNPDVVNAAANTLGVPATDLGGDVSGATTGATLTVTATAPTAAEAQNLAGAFGAAVTEGVKGQVNSYLADLQGRVDRGRQQLADLAGEASTSTNPQATAAQQTILTEQYQNAYAQQIAAQQVSDPVVSGTASTASLTSLALKTVLEAALLAGLLAGVGLALLRNWLDGRVIDAGDARLAAELPVVGALPIDSSTAKSGRPTVISPGEGDSAALEDVRRMRTAVSSTLNLADGSVVVVTGLVEGDGASFVAANLAAASARAGKTTIIASGDLRRPDLTEYFGIVNVDGREPGQNVQNGRPGRKSSRRGVDNGAAYQPNGAADSNGAADLNGGVTVPAAVDSPGTRRGTGLRPRGSALGLNTPVEEATRIAPRESGLPDPSGRGSMNPSRPAGQPRLVSTRVEGLSLLPSLVGLGANADALASERVRNVVGALRARADLVVLDSPPLFEFGDPLILAGYADAVVIVSRSRRTRSRDLARAAGMVVEADPNGKIGIVVNRIKRRRRGGTGSPIAPARRHGQRPRFQDLD